MTKPDEPRRIELQHSDGSSSPLLLVETVSAETANGEAATTKAVAAEPATAEPAGHAPGSRRPAVLVLPGLGVGARYYLPLARALAAAGVDTAITELRGQGESTHRIGRRGGAAGYHESAAEDVPLALAAMERQLGERRVVLLGHSMGAQLGVYHLARQDRRVAGLVAVASQSPFHRGFPGDMGRRLRFGSIVLPVVGALTGAVPATFFGASGKVPVDRIRDWSKLAAKGVMQPARADLDYPAALARVSVPALAVVLADDPLAPESAARGLLAMLPSAPTTLELEPDSRGHNSWARHPAPVVARVLAWMDREVGISPKNDDYDDYDDEA